MYLNSRFFYFLPVYLLFLVWYIISFASITELVAIYAVYFFVYSFATAFGGHMANCHSVYKTGPICSALYKLINTASLLGCPAWQKAGHLSHHKWAETDKDCQPVGVHQLRGYSDVTKIDKRFLVKSSREETKFDAFLREYYWETAAALHISAMLILGMKYYFFFFAFPNLLALFCIYIVRIIGHAKFLGYKNYDCPGYNIPWMFPFVFDDAWHNNHHYADIGRPVYRWYEFRVNKLWGALAKI